jgi:outer membrane protein TolC
MSLAVALTLPTAARAQGLSEVEATHRFCEQSVQRVLSDAAATRGEARVADSEVLPNPSISASHERTFGAAAEHETVVGLGVPLGIGGRRFVLQDAAAAWRTQLKLEAGADRIDAALAFRQRFVSAAVDGVRVTVERAQQERYQALLSKLTTLAESGEGARHDRLRLQTEAQLHAVSITSLEARVAAQRGWLEAMAGGKVKLSAKLDQLAQRPGPVRAAHPRVQSLQAAARAHGLEANAADRRWVPDLDIFAGYRNTGGPNQPTGHGFALELSLPLTFFDHGQGEAQRARAQQATAQARASQLERAQRATQKAAAARRAVLAKSATQLERAVTDAEKVRADTERLYLAGEGSLLAVLEAHRQLTALANARIDIAAAQAHARLRVMAANGRFGDRRLDLACGGDSK